MGHCSITMRVTSLMTLVVLLHSATAMFGDPKILDSALRCQACRFVTEQILGIQQKLGEKNKNLKLLVGGSMRGKQKKRPYYGSETMGMDVLEETCSDIFGQGYLLAKSMAGPRTVDPEEGRATGNGLQVYCQQLTEEYDAGIMELMFDEELKGEDHWAHWLCVEESADCTKKEYLKTFFKPKNLYQDDHETDDPVDATKQAAMNAAM